MLQTSTYFIYIAKTLVFLGMGVGGVEGLDVGLILSYNFYMYNILQILLSFIIYICNDNCCISPTMEIGTIKKMTVF